MSTTPQADIPFEIYERDDRVDARQQGWAITLHWALAFLRQLVSKDTLEAVDAAQVDPEVARNDTGNFLFLNLSTLETKFRIPPNERRRVGRLRFRQALLSDTRIAGRVHWGKRLEDIEVMDGGGVRVRFRDGSSSVDGSILVGAEGTNSRTRQFLAPETYRNQPLDVKLVGAGVDMTPEQARPLREIDPLLFQGCHPETNNFLWVSILDTPATNGTEGTEREYYRMQLILSWPVKTPADADVPSTPAGLAREMKRRAADFHPTLREAVNIVPDNGDDDDGPREIALQDWPCLPWDNRNGAVTLVGDAAHAMTMFRGEAANHGIMDAYHLVRALKEVYAGSKGLKETIDGYEEEMRERTSVAVLWSREACIGAHDYDGLNEKSAVMRRRAIKMPTD
jgi:2-polyprenyl-6-methoxyphenol hydroxylase-like FAD-dependent oxidoreductase